MHHKQTRVSKFKPILVIFILLLLVAAEIYFLFFQKDPSSTNSPSDETASSVAKIPKDVSQAANFNQEIQPDSELAKTIEKKITDTHFVGTALIIQKGQILLQKGYGYADVANNRPNTYQSIYQIGSVQKAMTAVLILQQVQAGHLSLDETLDHFYPYIPDSQKITIRQLLAMSSGLYQEGKPTIAMTEEEFLLFSITHANMGTYGKYKYEAVNYRILAGILEKLTNITYRELFTQTFIHHLQLSRTRFYDDFLTSLNRTYPYKDAEEQISAPLIEDNPLLFGQEIGTGNVGMTVSDLYHFYADLLGGKLLDPSITKDAWSEKTYGKYMGGLYNFSNYIKGHGVEDGFEANVMLTKDCQTGVILLSNQYQKSHTHLELTATIFETIAHLK
jgi:CubicO group peptidase (beta-lactamase class C family)